MINDLDRYFRPSADGCFATLAQLELYVRARMNHYANEFANRHSWRLLSRPISELRNGHEFALIETLLVAAPKAPGDVAPIIASVRIDSANLLKTHHEAIDKFVQAAAHTLMDMAIRAQSNGGAR